MKTLTPYLGARGATSVVMALAALALTATTSPARADESCIGSGLECPIWFDFATAPAEAQIGDSFTVEVTVHFPSGDYRGMALDITVPSGLSVIGSASPTTQEFDNAVAITGGRRWNQQNALDLSGGAANRKFNLTLTSSDRTLREGALKGFTVSIAGEVAPDPIGAPVPASDEPATHTVTMRGSVTMSWAAFGNGAGGGAITSEEAIPRVGILRRYVFSPQNTGNALLDPPVTFNMSFGPGYQFVRAFGAPWSTTFLPNPATPSANLVIDSQPATPWVQGAGTVTAHTIANNVGAALYVDLFIPCEAYGQTQAASDAQGTTYEVNATADATWRDDGGAVLDTFHLDHAPIGTQNLTAVCGAGGGLTKTEAGITVGGTGLRWGIVVNPPFGVDHVDHAMIVDLLPAAAASITAVANNGSDVDFERWSCDFSSFPGYFTAAEFLARRDAHCRTGYGGFQAGDTHFVWYAPVWRAEEGAMRSVSLSIQINVPLAFTLANPGLSVLNTAYFNGDISPFPALGDTAVEVGSEDPFEARSGSDPLPSTSATNVSVSRNGNPSNPGTALIDANAGVGSAYVHMATIGGLYAVNPIVKTSFPEGIVVDEIYDLAYQNCVDLPAAPAPTVSGRTVTWATGDATTPWTLDCNIVGRIRFHVDPLYPWIDGQAIGFAMQGTSDNAPPTSRALSFFAQVTTGMDVLLDGGCWTSESPVPPPHAGLQLFQATAVNRGSDDLADMELRFIVPPGGVYRTALPGPDLPVDAVIEVSRDHGATWSPAPPNADVAITDVRVAGLDILGDGLAAARPSFYVGIVPAPGAPSTLLTAGAWVATDSFELGQTPTKELTIDAASCTSACTCPDPTPDDTCSAAACNLDGACVPTLADNGTTCAVADDRCVTAAACAGGVCRATTTVTCGDDDTCTSDACDPDTGDCSYDARFDCAKERPIYLPLQKDGKTIGAVRCSIIQVDLGGGRIVERLRCDTEGESFRLFRDLGGACGG